MMSAFTIAPYTVIAGLAGSLLVAVVGGVPSRGSEAATPVRETPPPGLDGGSSKSISLAPTTRPSLPNPSYSAKVSAPHGSLANPDGH
jgi:hypothetical protein